jgi:hypothetical protein
MTKIFNISKDSYEELRKVSWKFFFIHHFFLGLCERVIQLLLVLYKHTLTHLKQ